MDITAGMGSMESMQDTGNMENIKNMGMAITENMTEIVSRQKAVIDEVAKGTLERAQECFDRCGDFRNGVFSVGKL